MFGARSYSCPGVDENSLTARTHVFTSAVCTLGRDFQKVFFGTFFVKYWIAKVNCQGFTWIKTSNYYVTKYVYFFKSLILKIKQKACRECKLWVHNLYVLLTLVWLGKLCKVRKCLPNDRYKIIVVPMCLKCSAVLIRALVYTVSIFLLGLAGLGLGSKRRAIQIIVGLTEGVGRC